MAELILSARLLALVISGLVGTSSTAYAQQPAENIQSIADASDRLLQAKPVQFRYKRPNLNGEKLIQYGLIAEEAAEVLPELIVNNKDGRPETVPYHLLPAMLLNELQKEHAQNQGHTHQLTAQEKLIHDQAEQIAKLQSRAAELDLLKARLVELERVTAQLVRMNGGDGVTVAAR
jgi:Chaperone of endosialidase